MIGTILLPLLKITCSPSVFLELEVVPLSSSNVRTAVSPSVNVCLTMLKLISLESFEGSITLPSEST